MSKRHYRLRLYRNEKIWLQEIFENKQDAQVAFSRLRCNKKTDKKILDEVFWDQILYRWVSFCILDGTAIN